MTIDRPCPEEECQIAIPGCQHPYACPKHPHGDHTHAFCPERLFAKEVKGGDE